MGKISNALLGLIPNEYIIRYRMFCWVKSVNLHEQEQEQEENVARLGRRLRRGNNRNNFHSEMHGSDHT